MMTIGRHDRPRRNPLRSALILTAGWLIVILGVIIWPLPGPMGLPTVAVGFSLILSQSRTARRMFVRFETRYPMLFIPLRRWIKKRRTPGPFARHHRRERLLRQQRLYQQHSAPADQPISDQAPSARGDQGREPMTIPQEHDGKGS